jgi:hypothetical protein
MHKQTNKQSLPEDLGVFTEDDDLGVLTSPGAGEMASS